MNTTNDGGIHPMAMKAARALSDRSADACGISREVQWAVAAAQFIADAHASLTECGALECFNALDLYVNGSSLSVDAPAMAKAAIAKVRDVSSAGKATAVEVYGSAQE
jgi:hypothetical protein